MYFNCLGEIADNCILGYLHRLMFKARRCYFLFQNRERKTLICKNVLYQLCNFQLNQGVSIAMFAFLFSSLPRDLMDESFLLKSCLSDRIQADHFSLHIVGSDRLCNQKRARPTVRWIQRWREIEITRLHPTPRE